MPPAVFRLKAGAGPVHISGQHLISKCCQGQNNRTLCVSFVWEVRFQTHFLIVSKVMEADQSFDEDDDDEEEEEEEDVKVSKKRPAASPASKSQVSLQVSRWDSSAVGPTWLDFNTLTISLQKKMKMEVDDDDDEDDDDEDDDDDE